MPFLRPRAFFSARRMLVAVAALPLLSASTKIYVANSDDDKVSVIDPASDKVVGQILVSRNPHGIVPSPDGARFYVSSESKDLLDVVDRKSGQIIRKIPIGSRPNN